MWFLNVYADPGVVLEEHLDVERDPYLDTNKYIRLSDNGENHQKETTEKNIAEKGNMNHLKQEILKKLKGESIIGHFGYRFPIQGGGGDC